MSVRCPDARLNQADGIIRPREGVDVHRKIFYHGRGIFGHDLQATY